LNVAGIAIGPECGEGGPPEPIRANPVSLNLDQYSYRIQLPVRAQGIDAGHGRQFTLAFSAAQSSKHDFQVVAILSNGQEIRSRPIELLYFVPAWYPKPNY
jgi:hypothetical protein